jgi:hypothetical protein
VVFPSVQLKVPGCTHAHEERTVLMLISTLHPSGSAAPAKSGAPKSFLHAGDLVISLLIVVVILLTRTG